MFRIQRIVAAIHCNNARRVADVPNDESLIDSFPNPHERDGVAVANYSDLIENRLEIAISPTTDRTEQGYRNCYRIQ